MRGNELPKNFFKQNQLEEISAAMLTHFKMVTLNSELDKQIDAVAVPAMNESRHKEYMIEREEIMSLTEGEKIVSHMRKIKEPINSSLLIKKALEYQDMIMPLVMKRIRTSGFDIFIENTAVLLANADDKYAEELYEIFEGIRNPYARSELSIVFGVKKMKKCTDLLLKQFVQIKQERPDDDYEQGSLLALNLIYE